MVGLLLLAVAACVVCMCLHGLGCVNYKIKHIFIPYIGKTKLIFTGNLGEFL